jgi:hypothetical protein
VLSSQHQEIIWKERKINLCNEGVGGVGGRSGYLLLHVEVGWEDSNWSGAACIKLMLAKQYRKEGGTGGTRVEGYI